MTRNYLELGLELGLVLGAVLAAACGGKTQAPTPALGNTAAAAPAAEGRGIRGVDFRTFTYRLAAVGDVDESFPVTNGECEFVFDADGEMMSADDFVRRYPGQSSQEHGSFTAAPPAYGDVDGDGDEDAVILTSYNGGGSGRFTSAWIYHLVDGAPVVLGVVPGGDRADHGLNQASIDTAGRVVVERNIGGDGACCPVATQLERWRWDGHDFVEDVAARGAITPFES